MSKFSYMHRVTLMSAVAAAVLQPEVVFARDAEHQTQASDSDQTAQLQDIVVTAQRRPERLQSAAIAAVAISPEALSAAGKVTIDAALSQTPAVRIQGNANGGQIYVRGVGSNADSQLGDTAVNLNFDGIYQQQTEAVVAGLFDIDRIEVLRGPQGTLYGRNATAGAVNIISNDPVLGKTGGSINGQYGNYDAVNVDGALNVAVGDTVAVRASGMHQSRDGYLSNGNNNADTTAGRAKILWQPNDRVRAMVGGYYMKIDDNGFGSISVPLVSGDPYQSDKPTGVRKIDTWGIQGNLDFDLDFATMSFIVGHSDFEKSETNVLLGTAPAVASYRKGELTSTEIRLSSAASSAVKWTVGAFYLDNLEVRKVIDSLISIPAIGASDPELQDASTESYAFFGNVTLPLADNLRVTGGLRYTNDRKAARFYFLDTTTPSEKSETQWDSVTYKVGAEMDLGAHSMLYAQVSSGFKAGGYAQQYPAGTYDPEKLTAYEIGSKNEFLDRTLRLNLSAFYYDYTNYQASYPDIVSGGFAIVTNNAATAELYGAEAELTYLPTRNDTFGLSLAYLHSQFGQFVYTSVLSGTVDHTGETMPAAPKWSADVSYEHRFDLGNGGQITAHANSHLSSGYWVSVERTTGSSQSSFSRSDAFLMYAPANEAFNVKVFVNNIENKAVRTLGLQNPFDAVVMLAPPRTYGIGFGLKF